MLDRTGRRRPWSWIKTTQRSIGLAASPTNTGTSMQPIDPGEMSRYQYVRLVISLTRGWVQYGILGFAIAFILISAVLGTLDR
jgi:hypothetical protein